MNDSAMMYLLLIGSAFFAGAVNAMAGGGTLLTFPALLAVPGLTSVQANATSTVSLLPGSVASVFGYRDEIRKTWPLVSRLILPSIVGSLIGTLLVTELPSKVFDQLVPWLILTAAVLFLVQPVLKKLIRTTHHEKPSARMVAVIMGGQFLIAVYGGYFGAGIGILMLSVLPFMGTDSIHDTNAAKTLLASVINLVSVVVFICQKEVVWTYAAVMIGAAIVGGYAGARVSRRIPAKYVRWLVIAIGFSLGAYYLWKQYAAPGVQE
ncbi:sulfite exporter TauE/SafE family protein [Zavarzinella formosa]|uniref:sulfite exporter TauE/SafE family protein n=1 Tax=Zavarzinella formosa TaxID=360055 RepID=UPI000319E0D8|nr:sulfite exporter TauE/SafE family protein [Zavarzinella formosa]